MALQLSLAMIVKDEDSVLDGVLSDAAGFCDELIVVDTGSSDSTVEIASARGAEVFSFDWVDDFSAARNFAIDRCSGEWIVWLDADDRVTPECQAAFRRLALEASGLDGTDLVLLPYRYEFEPWDSEICVTNFEIARMVRNGAGLRFVGRVHEFIPQPPGRTSRRSFPSVDHRSAPENRIGKPERNIRLLEAAIADGDDSWRTIYWLAFENRTLGRIEDAAAIYRGLLTRPLDRFERYGTLLDLTGCLQGPDHEEERVALYSAAIGVDSARVDAYVWLGLHHYVHEEWAAAIPLFRAAIACRTEPGVVRNESFSTWLPRDCLAICLGELGRFDEAIEEATLAIPGNPDRRRLLDNIGHYLDRVASGITRRR